MHLILLFLIDPKIVREFHKESVHRYKVHVESDISVTPETIDYILTARCQDEKKSNPGGNVEIRFTKFKATMGDQTVHKDVLGNGLLMLAETGLPIDIKTKLETEPFWYPVLTWFLPSEIKSGAFDVSQPIGGGMTLTGKGTYKEGEFDVVGKLEEKAGKSSDANLSWRVGADGWLVSGEGTVNTSAGSVTFKIGG